MSPQSYPSRIDAWLVMLVAGVLAVCIVEAILLLRTSPSEALFLVGFLVFMAALMWAVGWPCIYTLESDRLVIRSGLVRFRIPYGDIVSVAPSRNILSAPALSLRRVKIVHTRGFALVSPREREDFIAALNERALQARGAAAATPTGSRSPQNN